MGSTSTRRQSQPVSYSMEDDDALYETRMPSSARRYKPADTIDDPVIQKGTLIARRTGRTPRGTQTQGITSRAVAPSREEGRGVFSLFRRNPLVALLIGAVITILLLMMANMATTWWQGYQDNVRYGHPRTSHLETVVGHNDSVEKPTHFIFLNLRCKVQIIEIPGGDPAQTRVFHGPTLFGDKCDLIPVTGEIRDEQGKRNLIVHIQDQDVLFENDGKTFHPR